MNNEKLINTLIKKYELAEPVSIDVRLSMENSRRDNLVRILKQDARGALFIFAVVSFFLWIKKMGVSISIIKSAVAVTAAIVIGAGAITAAGVYGTLKITEYLSADKTKTGDKETTETEQTVIQEEKVNAEPEVTFYSLAVSQVEMDDVPVRVLSRYTDTVINELRRSRGPRAAVNFNMLDSYHKADRILSVSIIKLDEKPQTVYRISAKIISSANSHVLTHVSETVNKESEIPDALRTLAGKVSAGL